MYSGILAWTFPPIYDKARVWFAGGFNTVSSDDTLMLVAYYTCYGIGRGIFDSSNRELCANFFPGDLENIYALIRFTESMAALIMFNICPCYNGVPIDTTVIFAGCVSIACYTQVTKLDRTAERSHASTSMHVLT